MGALQAIYRTSRGKRQRNRWIPGVLIAAILVSPVHAADPLPQYQPHLAVSGVIRCWGSAQMVQLMENWQHGFQRFHPSVRFDNNMKGAASAIGGLYTGVADLSLSREIWPIESLAFEQVLGHKPTIFDVATGSYDVPTKSDALGVFVSAKNPISRLTMEQLDSVFGSRHVYSWGELGVEGEWSNQPIHPYVYPLDNAGALLFRSAVLRRTGRWNEDVTEFGNLEKPGGGRVDAGQRILDALASDPYGIAISNPHYAGPLVKALGLALSAAGPYVPLTRDTVASRAYPLTRGVFLFTDRLDSRISEFLRYILSREGRDDVIREGDYLPLPESVALQELTRIR
jgi:phosphate transport system substrate-binding protein